MERVAIVGSRAWPEDRARCVLDAARFVPPGTLVVTTDERGVARLVINGAKEAGHPVAVLLAPWDAVGFPAWEYRFRALVDLAPRVIVYRNEDLFDSSLERLIARLRKLGHALEVRS